MILAHIPVDGFRGISHLSLPLEQGNVLIGENAWRLGPSGMNAEESRRIAFHIRFNRPSAFFARCWLLVEGETEVWVMNELARQCGFHFAAEGIKVIEFAQSGLRPLLKFGHRMGIAGPVLTDGDLAGKNMPPQPEASCMNTGNPNTFISQNYPHWIWSISCISRDFQRFIIVLPVCP